MEFLGIGPLELIFIVLIALVLLGPTDMLKAAQTGGKILRTLVTSEGWREIKRSMDTLRNLPTSMMREAGLEEDLRTIKDAAQVQIPRIEIPIDVTSVAPKSGEGNAPSREPDQPVLIETPIHPPGEIGPDDNPPLPDDSEDSSPQSSADNPQEKMS